MVFQEGKLQPNSQEIEEIVLGAAMLERDGATTVVELLQPECFYNSDHSIIFSAIQAVYKRKDPVDIITVTSELKKTHQLEIIGGPYKITSLTSRVSASANTESHCRILLQLFIKRKIILLSSELYKNAYDDYFDSLDLLDIFSKESKKLYDHIIHGKIVSTEQIYNSTVESIKEAQKNGGIIGIPTGFKQIDNVLIGLRPGFKYIVAGLPGMGKTSFVKTLAVNLIKGGHPGAFFSLEMTSEQLMIHIMADVCEIDNQKLPKGNLSTQEELMIKQKMSKFPMHTLFIDDTASITTTQLRSAVKRLVRLFNIEWFVVDYSQMLKLPPSERKGKSKEEITSEVTYTIKEIAKEENISAIELSQLSRESDKRSDKRPSLSDLKYSGALEASADVVIFLHRPEYHGYRTVGPNKESADGYTEVIIGKNRHGKTGTILLDYIPQFTRFVDRDDSILLPEIKNDLEDF